VNKYKKKSRRDEKEKILGTKSLLPVKFITDPWRGHLLLKINGKFNI